MVKYSALTDAELVTLLKQSDEAAFGEIYNRYWGKLYSACYKRLEDKEFCMDVLQEVFADLWVKRENRDIRQLDAYLYTAARYQIFFLYKKQKHLVFFEEPLEILNTMALQPDTVYQAKELEECIAQWLKLQPEKRSNVFKMRFIEEKSTSEVSEMLNISQKTVQNQFATSLNLLRSHLGKLLSMFL